MNKHFCKVDHSKDNISDAFGISDELHENLSEKIKNRFKDFLCNNTSKSKLYADCICDIRKEIFDVECKEEEISDHELRIFTLASIFGRQAAKK